MKFSKTTLAAIAASTLIGGFAHADPCLDLGVTLCADWVQAGDTWHAEGDLSVDTPLGPITLANADVEATIDPPSLRGQVDVPMPDLGIFSGVAAAFQEPPADFLAGPVGPGGLDGPPDRGAEFATPRAEIALGYGAALEELEVGGQPMALDPDDTYLLLDYQTGFAAELGPITLSTGGDAGTLIIGPNEPMMYLGGDLLDLMPGGAIRGVAVGISFDGRLPWQSENPLWDGEELEPRSLDGHLLVEGDVRLGRYPIWVHGHAIYDLDADNDGQTVLDGDPRDFRLGMDGAVDIGIEAGALSLELPLGRASVTYDASQGEAGHLAFFAQDAGNIWEDTPLEFIQPGVQQQQTVYGYFRDLDDFAVHYENQASFRGFDAGLVQVELGNDGAWVSGTLQPHGMLPEVYVEGEVRRANRYSLRGTANVHLGSFELADAQITVNQNGVAVAGQAQLPHVGSIEVAGAFNQNGRASLSGRADVELAGFRLADALVQLDNNGMRIEGQVDLGPLGDAYLSGAVAADGTFSLEGAIALDLFGLNLSNARAILNNSGARIAARVNLGIANFDVEGAAGADGHFTLRGEANVSVGGIDLGTMEASVERGFRVFHINIGGTVFPMPAEFVEVNFSGRAGIPEIGNVNLSGGLRQSPNFFVARPFQLTGSTRLDIAGVDISDARIKISTSSVKVEGRVRFAGSRVKVSGRVYSSGRFTLRGEVDVGASLTIAGTGVTASGSMEVEVDGSDVSAEFDGEVCGKINYFIGSHKECAGFEVEVRSNGKICVDVPLLGRECIDIW